MNFLALILAAALVGPPAPKVYPTCPIGEECEGAKHHDRVLRYVAIQTAAGAFDIWATGYCVSKNPSCYETNPLGKTAEQRIAVKAATIAGFAIMANELDRHHHEHLAIGVTVVGVALQTFLGVKAIKMGNQNGSLH
jgi:hypothetical protein